jgi:hypothetical protein
MFSQIMKFLRLILSRLTGYALAAPEEKSSFSNPIIELEEDDFAIVFRTTKVEAIVSASHLEDREVTPEEEEIHAQTEGTISFLMHCLTRDDWQEEFFDAVEEYLENASEIEAVERRAQFKLISGDVDEDE